MSDFYQLRSKIWPQLTIISINPARSHAHAMKIADARYRVITYDRRGYGRWDQSFGDYDYDSLSDDLSDFMKSTTAEDASLVGFLLGGSEVVR